MKGLPKEMVNLPNMIANGKMTDREIEKMHFGKSKMQKMISDKMIKINRALSLLRIGRFLLRSRAQCCLYIRIHQPAGG
jgi:hypothetical protein